MALSQRLSAILHFKAVLQANATRTQKIPNTYGHSRFFRATRMRHGRRRCSLCVRGCARPCELLQRFADGFVNTVSVDTGSWRASTLLQSRRAAAYLVSQFYYRYNISHSMREVVGG